MDQMPLNIDPSLMQTGNVSRGGMFGGGGKFGLKEALAFGLAGLVSRRNPALLQGLMGMVAQRQRQAQEDAQYQRQRQDGMADWQAKQLWELEHPKPVVNDTVNDYRFISEALGPDAGKRFLETKTNPIVMTPYGPMPYSAVNGGGQVPAPVGKLTPIQEGGPMPQASGGFPRPY